MDLISGAQLNEYLDQERGCFSGYADVRAYHRVHIRGAVNIPYGELASQDRGAAAGESDRALLLPWTEQHAGGQMAGLSGI